MTPIRTGFVKGGEIRHIEVSHLITRGSPLVLMPRRQAVLRAVFRVSPEIMPRSVLGTKTGLIVMVIATGWTLCACGEPSLGAVAPEPEEHLRLVEQPPIAPPAVEIQGINIEPAAYEWVIDNVPSVYHAANSAADVPLPAISPVDQKLVINIKAEPRPGLAP